MLRLEKTNFIGFPTTISLVKLWVFFHKKSNFSLIIKQLSNFSQDCAGLQQIGSICCFSDTTSCVIADFPVLTVGTSNKRYR
jgi:hypothetical protein